MLHFKKREITQPEKKKLKELLKIQKRFEYFQFISWKEKTGHAK